MTKQKAPTTLRVRGVVYVVVDSEGNQISAHINLDRAKAIAAATETPSSPGGVVWCVLYRTEGSFLIHPDRPDDLEDDPEDVHPSRPTDGVFETWSLVR